MISPSRTETGVGGEGKREKRPTPNLCGTGSTNSCSIAGLERSDGGGDADAESNCRNCRRDGEGGIGSLDDGMSNRVWQGGSGVERALEPSFEIPEWSPMAIFEPDRGMNGAVDGSGCPCGGSGGDGDFRFRVCDAREQTVPGGGSCGGRGGGGGRDSGGHGSGGGEGVRDVPPPFAPTEVVRAERVAAAGEEVPESDHKLVALLRQRPKDVPQVCY